MKSFGYFIIQIPYHKDVLKLIQFNTEICSVINTVYKKNHVL